MERILLGVAKIGILVAFLMCLLVLMAALQLPGAPEWLQSTEDGLGRVRDGGFAIAFLILLTFAFRVVGKTE